MHRRSLAALAAGLVFVRPVGVEPAGPQDVDIPVVRLATVAERQAGDGSLPATRLEDGQRSGDLDATRAVSLTFAEPLAARDVLLLLFRGTSFSIVFEPGAGGVFAGELAELTLRQALEAVAAAAGLDYEIRDRVIRVFPRRPRTRLFEVSHLNVTRAWQRRVRPDGTGASGVAADLTAGAEPDFFRDLGNGVAALLSPSGRVHVDRTAGVVQVTDFADRLDQVGLYIETATLRATRQVRLDARVLEVTLGERPAIDWPAVSARAGIRPGTGAGIKVEDFAALLREVEAFGRVRTIAAPHVLAMNNEPAVMRIGRERAAFTTADGAARGGAATTDGLTLSVTAQISADGIVHMSVSPTLAGPRASAAGGEITPLVELDTTLRVRSGETVVIAGVLGEQVETTPPRGLAGIFGGREQVKTARAELVILLTPTVVTPGSTPAAGER